MLFSVGKRMFESVDKDTCLFYLYQKIPLFVIHNKYEKALLGITPDIDIHHIVNMGRMIIPISENDNENEQVFYGDLKNLKQYYTDYNIDNYLFFKVVEIS